MRSSRAAPPAFSLREQVIRVLDKDGDGAVSKEELQEASQDALAQIEKLVAKVRSLPRLPKRAYEVAGGAMLVFYGENFASSVLFLEAFRATGWPFVKNAWSELCKSYVRAREVARQNMPQLVKTKELIPTLIQQKKDAEATMKEMYRFTKKAAKEQQLAEAQMNRAKRALDSLLQRRDGGADVSADKVQDLTAEAKSAQDSALKAAQMAAEASELQAKAMANFDAVRSSLDEAMASVSALKAIADAVDPQHLADCARGVGTGVLSCVAAAQAPLARAACIGADLGNQLADQVKPFVNSTLLKMRRVPPSVADWGACLASSACTAGVAYAAWQLQELSLTVAACALGAKTLVKATTRQINQTFDVGLDALQVGANMTVAGAMEVLLTAGGVASQLGPSRGNLPGIAKLLFSPLLALEAYLKVLAGSAAAVKPAGR